MNIKKFGFTLVINIIVFFALIITVETIGFLLREKDGEVRIGWIYRDRDLAIEAITNNCWRMRTHPFYTHTHDDPMRMCEIKGGYADGPFVFYDAAQSSKDAVLVLGGSTTDGWFGHYSDGNTWPFLLSQILSNSEAPLQVINGGVGGYNSSQELLKLLIDGQRLKNNVKYVISLNGINDLPGQSGGLSKEMESELPFWSKTLLDQFRYQKWTNLAGTTFWPRYLPNTHWILRKFLDFMLAGTDGREKKSEQRWETALLLTHNQQRNSAEKWLLNVKMMHAISKEMGAEYHVFLQPTMGISGVQTPRPDNSSEDYNLYEKYADDKEYWKKIQDLYGKLKVCCSKIDFCHDISDVAPPDGNYYSNIRHHNANGNAIIADEIYRTVFENQ